jgi:nucleoside-diphosphate-sugar epimerase
MWLIQKFMLWAVRYILSSCQNFSKAKFEWGGWLFNTPIVGFVLQVRDYIHVMDLADGHIAALHKLFKSPDIGKNRKSF